MRRIARSNSNSFNNVWIKSLKQSINATQTEHASKKYKFSEEYREYSELTKNEVETALSEHQSWDHKIKLKEEKQLTFEPIYQLSKNKLKILKKYIEVNLKKKFIKFSKSSTNYFILFALKKNEKLRLCVNYRQFNNITIKNRYALSLISKLQKRTNKAQMFNKINLRENYYRIRMKEEKKWKTAFRTRYEHYEYQIMLFELINTSATMQTLINDILKKFLNNFIIIYLNDILIYS